MGRENVEGLLRDTLRHVHSITVLGGVLDSGVGRDLIALIELLRAEEVDPTDVSTTYARLWRGLAREPDGAFTDAWQSHLLRRLLEDENGFSLRASRGGASSVGPGLREQVRRDLRALQKLFELHAAFLCDLAADAAQVHGTWQPWTRIGIAVDEEQALTGGVIGALFAQAADWGDCVDELAAHFSKSGTGTFARYRAFRWSSDGLRPARRPDPIRLSELVGYDGQRASLMINTERFLAGLPAQHVLLYGRAGTGKSSTVKAVLNEYADEGLRLAEVSKEDLRDLPRVLEALEEAPLRFILFLDDLSFDEGEVEYKVLKTLLEGSVVSSRDNVRVYATTNRRNLVRETFAEREEEVNPQEGVQDKQALAARFGLRIKMPTPKRDEFLKMVGDLARMRGVRADESELRRRAAQWDQWHDSRSGRSVRQLVDELEAEMLEDGRRRSSPTGEGLA